MKKVYSTCIDVMGTDAGTLYVCAESIDEAQKIMKDELDSSVTYVGKLSEGSGKYWPSETYGILGESDGLMFPVDEAAEEAEQAAAEAAWQNEQMDELFKEKETQPDMVEVVPQDNKVDLKNIAVQFQDELVMLYTTSIERAREAILHAFADGKIDEPQDIYEIPDSDMQFHCFDGHVWDAGKELDWSKVQISSIASRASENKTLRDALAALNSKNQNLQIK